MQQSKNFTRRIEDFQCEVCGTKVKGTGYTNHCPNCLHSKHVDINPGDRASSCGGIMQPIAVSKRGETYYITHRCKLCWHEKANKVSQNDNFEEIIKLSQLGTH